MSKAADQRIWNEGCDPRGMLAEPYLREGRKLDLPNDLARTMLAFLPRCPWRGGTGRMGAIAVDVETSKSLDGTPSFCRQTSRPQARQVRL
jgi:hypothetical protein